MTVTITAPMRFCPCLAASLLALASAVPTTAQTLPNIGNYSLPASEPRPAPTPTPLPSATPTPVPQPTIPLPIPSPTAAPSAVPARTREPSPTPTPRATPVPRPTPSPTASAATSPPPLTEVKTSAGEVAAPAPAPAPDMRAADRGSGWAWWPVVLGIAALAAVAFLIFRRKRAGGQPVALPSPDAPPPPAMPIAPVPVPVAAAQDAALDIAFRPTRAGLNMMSAVVEGELTVTNTGTTSADAIRVAATLLSAHKEQDADLAAVLAQPIGRPVVPAFALAPGEARTIRVVAPLARAAIQAMTAAGRPMFVPIVAFGGTFGTGASMVRIGSAFVVGVERVDSSKLAPFWLDVQPRMFDTVAARPQSIAGIRSS